MNPENLDGPREPNDDELAERIRAYVDGELCPDEVARLRREARNNPELARELRAQLDLYRFFHELPHTPSDALPTRPSLRLRAPSWMRRAGRARAPVWVAGALGLFAFALGLWEGHRRADRAATAQENTNVAIPVRFFFAGEAKSVLLLGTFNHWKPQPLTRVAPGLWETTLPLPHGLHRYGFQVDGHWRADPLATELVPDGMGNEDAQLEL